MTRKMLLAVLVLLLSLSFIACESPCAHGGDMIEKTVKKATCTEAGVIQTICANCGTVVRSTTVDYGGHDWKETVTEATCTKDGKRSTICSRCGLNKNPDEPYEVIKALNHDWDNTAYSYHEPTCTRIGGEIRICQRFGCTVVQTKPGTEAVDKLGHDYESEVLVAATCTKQGIMKETCKNCGDVVEELIGMTAHDLDAPVEETPATCAGLGVEVGICKVCGQEERSSIARLGHHFSSGICSVCGMEEPSAGLEYTLNASAEETKESYYSVKKGTCTAADIVIADIYRSDESSPWLPVTVIEDNAFEKSNEITSITIPATIADDGIGINFIGQCYSLTKLNIHGDEFNRFDNMSEWISYNKIKTNAMPDRIWVDYIEKNNIPNISTIDRATVQVGDEFVDDYDHLVKVFYVADNGNTIYAVDPMGYYNNEYGLYNDSDIPTNIDDVNSAINGLYYSSDTSNALEIFNRDLENGIRYSEALEGGKADALKNAVEGGVSNPTIWTNLDNRRERTGSSGNRNTKWFIPSAGELSKIFTKEVNGEGNGVIEREAIVYWTSNRNIGARKNYDSTLMTTVGRFEHSVSTSRARLCASFLALDLSAEQ